MVPADPGPHSYGLEILRARHYTRVWIVALPLAAEEFFQRLLVHVAGSEVSCAQT
jgi:hypothetical protein